MPRVNVTTTDGEQVKVACPGVPKSDIDAGYIEQRTNLSVESLTVTKDVADRVRDLEAAVGVGGSGKTGIANRIDDLESRVEQLESQ